MCLAIPGKVEAITTDGLIRVGRVNFGGVIKNVCLDYVPEVEVGDYTIVHVGFALSKIDEETAEQTLKEFREMGCLDQELEEGDEAFARAAEAPQMMCPASSCKVLKGTIQFPVDRPLAKALVARIVKALVAANEVKAGG